MMSVLRSVSDRVRSAWEFFGDREFRKDRKALMAKRRFRLSSSWDELGEHESAVRKVDDIRRSGRIEELEPLFRTAHAAGLLLPGGCSVHEAMDRRLFGATPENPDEQQIYLAPFRAAFDRAPSPFMAAIVANALIRCSDESRGAKTVDETSPQQWAAYAEHRAEARHVLDAFPDREGTCPVWQRANYDLAVEEAPSREAFDEAFERAWAIDRHNLNLCADHGIMMLPRWLGRGPRDLEVFARRAIAMTEARFGAGAYAFIYSIQAGIADHEVTDTLCDQDLLVQGFEDLTERFPDSQSLLNRHIMTLDWTGDYEAVYPLQKRLDTINPNLWGWSYDDEASGVDDALDAVLIAKETAVANRMDRET
jgi:hypothetical protein